MNCPYLSHTHIHTHTKPPKTTTNKQTGKDIETRKKQVKHDQEYASYMIYNFEMKVTALSEQNKEQLL